MAHLLHLSDLHLRSDAARDTIGDPKDAAIPVPLQQTSARRIVSTLEALGRDIAAGELTLDCIVISGDIADRNDPTAYTLLPRILEPLVPKLVPAERVVVVPGNATDQIRAAAFTNPAAASDAAWAAADTLHTAAAALGSQELHQAAFALG